MSISRCWAQKAVSRGMKSSLAKKGGSRTRSMRLSPRRATWARLRSSASSSGSISSKRSVPAAVSSRARDLRTKRATPSVSSSSFIWWLIADGVRYNSSAANLKLRCRAATQNARKFLVGGGRERRIMRAAATVVGWPRWCKNHALLPSRYSGGPSHFRGRGGRRCIDWARDGSARTGAAHASSVLAVRRCWNAGSVQRAVQPLRETDRIQRAGLACELASRAKEDQRGNAADTQAPGELRLLVGVDFSYAKLRRAAGRRALQDRREHAAGPAPGRPEVHENRQRRALDVRGKRGCVEWNRLAAQQVCLATRALGVLSRSRRGHADEGLTLRAGRQQGAGGDFGGHVGCMGPGLGDSKRRGLGFALRAP